MEAEHTSGPWKAELANADATDGSMKFWMVTAGPDHKAVAQMPWCDLGILPEDEGNARLIAAAPDMKAQLQSTLGTLVMMASAFPLGSATRDTLEEECAAIRAALSKARGETT